MSDFKINGGVFHGSHFGDNVQTVHAGPGAQIDSITQDNRAARLEEHLRSLETSVDELTRHLPAAEADKARADLADLRKVALSKEPSKRWYDISAEGLLGAAKGVAGLGESIAKAIAAMSPLLFG
jgi:hypothetical protein